MAARLGVRQKAALDAVAIAAPAPVPMLVMRRAIRALRPGDAAKDATDSLLVNGYVRCSDEACPGQGRHQCTYVLTDKGRRARRLPVAQWGQSRAA